MNTKKYLNWSKNSLIFLLLIILSVLGVDRCGRKAKMQDQENVITGLNTTIRKKTDSEGRETARANSFYISYKAMKSLHLKDSSTLKELQELVDKKTRAAIVVKNTTSGSVTGVTTYTIVDTVQGPCDTVFPVYNSTIKDKWSDFKITSSKDSTHLDYTIKNEFQFKQHDEKQGKWPRRQNVPIVEVKSLNPHTRTDEIAAYAVSTPKPKRLGWFIGGAATTAIVVTVIKIFLPK